MWQVTWQLFPAHESSRLWQCYCVISWKDGTTCVLPYLTEHMVLANKKDICGEVHMILKDLYLRAKYLSMYLIYLSISLSIHPSISIYLYMHPSISPSYNPTNPCSHIYSFV